MRHDVLNPMHLCIENDQIRHFMPGLLYKNEFCEVQQQTAIPFSVKLEFFVHGILHTPKPKDKLL